MHAQEYITYGRWLKLTKLFPHDRSIKKSDHVGMKLDLDSSVSVIILFTSNLNTLLPGLKSPVDNFSLQYEGDMVNMFRFVNPMQFVLSYDFYHYFTISDCLDNFPKNIQKYSQEEIVRHAVRGFYHSYRKSLAQDPLFIKHSVGKLMYAKFSQDIMIASSLGMMDPYYSKLYQGFLRTNQLVTIATHINRIQRGFSTQEQMS